MNISSSLWIGSDLSDAEFAEVALQLVSREDIALLPNMLVLAERHADFWPTDEGQAVLAGMLNLLVDTLDAGDIAGRPLGAQAHGRRDRRLVRGRNRRLVTSRRDR